LSLNQQTNADLVRQMLADAKAALEARVSEKSIKRPETDDDLYEWIRDVLGYKIARYPTDPEHQSPFQLIADAFFERHPVLLAQGPRGGGKTLNYAIFELASMVFKEDIWIVAVAGSEGQARDGFTYLSGKKEKDGVEGMIYSPLFRSMISGEPSVTKTVFTNGARVEIRTGGSEKAVSGPHPQVLIVDELDHIESGPLNTALQMPQSNKKYKSTTVMASSQYHASGTLQNLLDKAKESGIAIYRFDIFDIMESCGKRYPVECGDCPFHTWRNPFTGSMEELCKGRGERSNGHYPFEDAKSKFATIDAESFAMQSLLMSGRHQGMVYTQYGLHNKVEITPGAATITIKYADGREEERDISTWRAFAGIDMRSHGRIVVVLESPEILPNGKHPRYCVAEWSDDMSTPSKLIDACEVMKKRVLQDFGVPISAFWGELAAADMIKGFPPELNAKPIAKENVNVMSGVGKLRDAFMDNSQTPSLFIDQTRCPDLHESLSKLYKCKKLSDGTFNRDAFGDEGSHSSDALRYAYVGSYVSPTSLPRHESGNKEAQYEQMHRSIANLQAKYSGGRWSPY
jgi:hypothetical protein